MCIAPMYSIFARTDQIRGGLDNIYEFKIINMKKIKEYKEFTTIITIYKDEQGNEFHYEDGELKYTNIYHEELTYDSIGTKYTMDGNEVF